MTLPLLLHMHQPDYRHPATGEPVLPWVRKHALRGYRDVPWLLHRTGARATINLVPSLLDQLDHYAAGGMDPAFRLLHIPFASLSAEQRLQLADEATLGSPRRLAWFPAFARLVERPAASLSEPELLDRIVWGELAWFGFSALTDHPILARFRLQGTGFTQVDLDAVVAIQREILRELRALYQGLPEVSASPWFHPILPLLVNTAHADRCLPGVPDPGFAFPEDAEDQLRQGKARVSAWIGAPVIGLWPSEGSVSPEVVRMAAALGFDWIASDEEVLARSDPNADPSRPARFENATLVFRDHALSDRVGFTYQGWPGERAAVDLIRRAGNRPALLALDGENPWEHYEDAGEAFLTALLTSRHTSTVGDFVRDTPARGIDQLHTGSWIHADFKIWIGHEEDRAAWRLLAAARRTWDRVGRPEAARLHLYAAEGSDWFWWYGDEFSNPVGHIFDELFRAHLTAAYQAMDVEPDPALDLPIRTEDAGEIPVFAIGEADDWLAWQSASLLTIRGSAMARVGGPRRLWVGLRHDELIVRAIHAEGWAVGPTGTEARITDGAAILAFSSVFALHAPDGEHVAAWRLRVG